MYTTIKCGYAVDDIQSLLQTFANTVKKKNNLKFVMLSCIAAAVASRDEHQINSSTPTDIKLNCV